jgi:hypothetical protein
LTPRKPFSTRECRGCLAEHAKKPPSSVRNRCLGARFAGHLLEIQS